MRVQAIDGFRNQCSGGSFNGQPQARACLGPTGFEHIVTRFEASSTAGRESRSLRSQFGDNRMLR